MITYTEPPWTLAMTCVKEVSPKVQASLCDVSHIHGSKLLWLICVHNSRWLKGGGLLSIWRYTFFRSTSFKDHFLQGKPAFGKGE